MVIAEKQSHQIVDNLSTPSLGSELEKLVIQAERADFCVGYFNLRGWREIAEAVDTVNGGYVEEDGDEEFRYCRLIIGMQKMPIDIIRDYFEKQGNVNSELLKQAITDNTTAVRIKRKVTEELRQQLTVGVPTTYDEYILRQLVRQLKSKKVVVKLYLRQLLHAKLYLAYQADKTINSFLGSSNLTLSGLTHQAEMNTDIFEPDTTRRLAEWFNDRWDDRLSLDITQELIEILEQSWASDRLVSPYHVYLKMAYHLSREAQAGIDQYSIPKIFQRELLDFQEKAVQIAAQHLHKRGGVLLGDVVGLGKTITATALAKTVEFAYPEVLVICPATLVTMWENYRIQYQLNALVMSLQQAQTKLKDLRRYRLVIIDESHNLRNSDGKRFRAIRSYIEENESRVILLSATPYNKTYLDLSNQLRLFLSDDQDLGITPENLIRALGGEVQFAAKFPELFQRSIRAFEKSEEPDDWRELMRLYMVRRTRSFVKENYATYDEERQRYYLTFKDGSRSYFPDRLSKKVEYGFDPEDVTDQYARLYSPEVVAIITSLNLPRYGLGNYELPIKHVTPSVDEAALLANLSHAGQRLMGFCRTNLFKRLESCGYSFLLSLCRHAVRNYVFLYALDNGLPLPVGQQLSDLIDPDLTDEDEDDEDITLLTDEAEYYEKAQRIYERYRSPRHYARFNWIRSEFFVPELKSSLIYDARALLSILKKNDNWHPSQDRQLRALADLCSTRHRTEKILIFTQFADTARYLCRQLAQLNLGSIDCVTGQTEDPSLLVRRFSPVSNGAKTNKIQELRILVTTDRLSEGHNLQDSHIILNYDLPWAIIRLIQRAGRVDRIGQQSDNILCYSFLPEEGIEQIINLRERLRNRMAENAEVVGTDEVFFEGDKVVLHDLYNENSKMLDNEDTDTEVDLSSYAYQVWKNAVDRDPSLLKTIPNLPNVTYATKTNDNQGISGSGVVVYARTPDDNDVLTWLDEKGSVITQSQLAILRAAECAPGTPGLPRLEHHHDLVQQGVDLIRREEASTGGTLGRKTSIKYRLYTRLEDYAKQYEDTLFTMDDLKDTLDELYRYPLKEWAKDALNRALRTGINDTDLAKLVLSLREEDRLCIIREEELTYRQPQIICSLGIQADSSVPTTPCA
ncbi:helicase-related protein [Salmonirosea aquatica]|uniref:NgoFVII family restriction endonuclease n=1 Tax=Salmonirosea aquatica TaxID=2654236 RepID=A0A7C9BG37_9BACT|nr:NgoFVII family restriction endonuclease [Cytophagaceae bacterium SJW1-29]